MSTPDPVTAPTVLASSDDQLYTAAVDAVSLVLGRSWTQHSEQVLRRNATVLVDLAIEVGPRDAVVLIRDNPPDMARLAGAVLATDLNHNGQEPNPADLQAAARVIETLLGSGGDR